MLRRLAASALAMSGSSIHVTGFVAPVVTTSCSNNICKAYSSSPFMSRANLSTARRMKAAAYGSSRLRMASTLSTASPPEVARAAHILVKDEETADSVLKRIAAGERFVELARELSSCPSRGKGGDMGWFKRGAMVPEFEDACFDPSKQTGDLVKVKTEFGWHVIAIVGRATEPMQMNVSQLRKIVLSIKADPSLLSQYQLIDVREPNELFLANIREPRFTNLPLSQSNKWGPSILGEENGDESSDDVKLDKEKETIILCHMGMRSQQMAEFLTYRAKFKKVWNVEGGIKAYAEEDRSVGTY